MRQVTGMGCLASAITAAFLAVNQSVLLGCAYAAIIMGITGEIAAKNCKGPGSFKVGFIDALSALTLNEIEARTRVDIL